MIHVLQPRAYPSVALLAAGLRDQGMAQAILAGSRPGLVLANHEAKPTSLFIVAPEGEFSWTYVAGDPSDDAFNSEIRRWFFQTCCPENGIDFSFLAADSDDWDASVAAILAPRKPIRDRRLYYTSPQLPREWQDSVPEGYEIRRLNRDLFSSDVRIPTKVGEWLESNFGSREAFLRHGGLGAIATHEGEVVSWCLTDSVVGDRADIGVETVEPHQRKGLAYATTCLVLESALERGIRRVGWHCHAINVPSVKTATRAGFELQYEYVLYFFYVDLAKHEKLVEFVGKASETAAS